MSNTTVTIEDQHSDNIAHFTNPTRENITTTLQSWFIDPNQGGIPGGLDCGVAEAIEDLADDICRQDDTNGLEQFLGLRVR